MKYEERVICFIDILGFKDHIKKSIEDESYIDHIFTGLDTILNIANREVGSALDRDIDLCCTQFSDSIVLSYKVSSRDQLAFLILLLSEVTNELLKNDFLLRGAITYGKVIHKDNRLFGPAMNEVYELESKYAVYPRIIIPRKVFEKAKFSSEYKYLAQERIIEQCKMDEDRWYYIDYIDGKLNSNGMASDYLQNIQKFCNIINKDLENPDLKIQEKYRWIYRKLSDELECFKENYNNISSFEEELFVSLREQLKHFKAVLE